jgi:hypothetical protein
MSTQFVISIAMFFILSLIIGGVMTQQYLDSDPSGVKGRIIGVIDQPIYVADSQAASIATPTMNADIPNAFLNFVWIDSPFWKDPEWGAQLLYFKWIFFVPLAVGVVWGFASLFGSAIQGLFSK